MALVPKAMYRFNVISIKLPIALIHRPRTSGGGGGHSCLKIDYKRLFMPCLFTSTKRIKDLTVKKKKEF